jgi:hypothetical protein
LARHSTAQYDNAVTKKREQHERDRDQKKRIECERREEVAVKNLV